MVGRAREAAATRERFMEKAEGSAGTAKLHDASGWRQYFAERWPFEDPENFDHLMMALEMAGLPV